MSADQSPAAPTVTLRLARTDDHPCPYLPDRRETDLIVLNSHVNATVYHALMDAGFRRSGRVFYRPDCDGCRACVPIRVPVARFTPSSSQRRVLRRNQDVRVETARPTCDERRLDLYRRYETQQHGKPEPGGAAEYAASFCDSPIDTWEMSYWLDDRLIAIGLVDQTPLALSSVYFIYDPDLSRRSLGVFSALCEIAACRQRGLPFWYIGFHVLGCAKMEYKSRFRPFELLDDDGVWRAAAAPQP